MGRGPGNTKTEEIIYKLKKKIKDRLLKILIRENFLRLKKKYKWGKNIYYYKSAKYKIHPTFIQEILSDDRIKKSQKMRVINYLRNSPSKKFNPNLIHNFMKFQKNNGQKSKLFPKNYFRNKKILLVGNGLINKNKLKKIKILLKRNDISSMSINLNKYLDNKFIDTHIFAHPLRFKSQFKLLRKINGKIVFPVSFLGKNDFVDENLNKKNIFNYDLKIKDSNKIIIRQDGCSLPSALGLDYGVSLAISRGCKKIILAGVDIGKSKVVNDNSYLFIKYFKRKFKKINFSII